MNDITEFTNLYQEENEKLFEQGIWLAEHCVDKKSEAEIKFACGVECGASADTINKRLRVGRVFGDQYFVDCNWSLHVAACEIAKADGKDEVATNSAFTLMEIATEGYFDEKGVKRPHSARTLKAKYAASPGSGKPAKPDYIMHNQPAYLRLVEVMDTVPTSVIAPFASITRITVDIEGEYELHDLSGIAVTITRQPQPETVNAGDESEADAA